MASSGVINGSTNNQYIDCEAQWSSVDNVGGNYSTVTVKFYGWRTNTGYTSTGTTKFVFKINGTSYSSAQVTKSITNTTKVLMWEKSVTVNHLADGTKSCAISITGELAGSSWDSTTCSGTAVLSVLMSTPAAPTIGTNTRNSDTSNTIGWTNHATTSAPYSQVMVERSVDGGAFAQLGALAGTATSWTDTTTSANHSYQYRVRAYNTVGYSSYSASSAATYNTPAAPSGCAVTQTGPTSTSVSWIDGSRTETAFEISRSTDNGSTWSVLGSVGAGVVTYADSVTAGTTVLYRVQATRNTLVSAYSTSSSLEIAVGATFTSTHTVVNTGMLLKVKYSVTYATSPTWHANVKVYHGTVAGELLKNTTLEPDTELDIGHLVTAGDTITMVVTTVSPIVGGSWTTDFYEAVEDNTWTFLGYADDQLVGMTANNQLWNGTEGEYKLANAKKLTDPSALAISNFTAKGTGLTIAAADATTGATTNSACPFRVSVSYTILNRFGPTLPSPMFTFYASKPSTEWTTASYVEIKGTAPNYYATPLPAGFWGVTAIELYYTEGEYQEPAFLGRVNIPEDSVVAPVATKPWTFNWTGYMTDTSMWTIANLTPPTENYTNGAPASKMAALDGQLYFWGGSPGYRIWIGGNPGNRFSVSPGTGGGFVDVDPGTGTLVTDVLKFKTQQGAAIVTALCDNANSQREHRFNLIESKISISDEQSVKGWSAEKIAGTVGCKSSRGAVVAGDGLYAVSRYGLAITTLTMEYNSQLQVMYVSDNIAPVFLKQYGHQLDASVLFAVNGILYMTFGSLDGSLDNVLFCYDIGLKAWWTYTLDTDTAILNMVSIDYDGHREGIGIITADGVYLLPTTMDEAIDVLPEHEVLIESGELTTMQPLQVMHRLTQLEFRFDYFIGDMTIDVIMVDRFGRTITTTKNISHATKQHQLSEHIRIDKVVESYKIIMRGKAKMRLTHFNSKSYPKPMRIGLTKGFDSRQSDLSPNLIRRTFTSYNDVREAIIP